MIPFGSPFDRTKGRLVPTPQAMLFHEEVAGSFKSARDLMAVAQNIRDLGQSKLRVDALAASSLVLVPTVLRRFREQHPGAIANVAVRSSTNIVAAVATQRLDVGIVDGGISILDAIGIATFRFPSVCAMDAGHPLASREAITFADLARFPFASLGADYMNRSVSGRSLLESVNERIEVETFRSFLACGFVLASEALAVVDPLTAKFYEQIGLVSRPLADEIPFELTIVVNHRSKADNGVQAFVGLLPSNMREVDHRCCL
jgi:DNA-binding transcriptional LysR family regulator